METLGKSITKPNVSSILSSVEETFSYPSITTICHVTRDDTRKKLSTAFGAKKIKIFIPHSSNYSTPHLISKILKSNIIFRSVDYWFNNLKFLLLINFKYQVYIHISFPQTKKEPFIFHCR